MDSVVPEVSGDHLRVGWAPWGLCGEEAGAEHGTFGPRTADVFSGKLARLAVSGSSPGVVPLAEGRRAGWARWAGPEGRGLQGRQRMQGLSWTGEESPRVLARGWGRGEGWEGAPGKVPETPTDCDAIQSTSVPLQTPFLWGERPPAPSWFMRVAHTRPRAPLRPWLPWPGACARPHSVLFTSLFPLSLLPPHPFPPPNGAYFSAFNLHPRQSTLNTLYSY